MTSFNSGAALMSLDDYTKQFVELPPKKGHVKEKHRHRFHAYNYNQRNHPSTSSSPSSQVEADGFANTISESNSQQISFETSNFNEMYDSQQPDEYSDAHRHESGNWTNINFRGNSMPIKTKEQQQQIQITKHQFSQEEKDASRNAHNNNAFNKMPTSPVLQPPQSNNEVWRNPMNQKPLRLVDLMNSNSYPQGSNAFMIARNVEILVNHVAQKPEITATSRPPMIRGQACYSNNAAANNEIQENNTGTMVSRKFT